MIDFVMQSMQSSKWQKYPKILEINAATWLHGLSESLNSEITLKNIPNEVIDKQFSNYDAIWLMGIWKRSQKSREVSIYWEKINHEYAKVLPNYDEGRDLIGSAYSVSEYTVNPEFGGLSGIKKIYNELKTRGIHLILDFVSNHTAIDNHWAKS
ncbi:MAG: hypothetical protein GY870_00555, partial [archaeon]|nr:hypothetical protein [archaeon]